MPIELAGISNENEFYSEHYLSTIFEGDIEETFREWKDAEKAGNTPPNKLMEKVGVQWRRLSAAYLEERDDRKRLLIGRAFAHEMLTALGFERRSELVVDAEGKLIPVLARRAFHDGREAVWVVEVPSPGGADFEVDPLQIRFRCEQFEGIETAEEVEKRRKDNAEAALAKGIFALEAPPRFVVLLSMSQAVLIDRNKWSDSRLLRFRFPEIFGRGDNATVGVTTALLHAESLAPGSGTSLIDRIDEESHRHAFGVSQDLKYALREAIELLGNEAAQQILEKGVVRYTGKNALDAEKLTTECLRYMYRLLFLFFIEARPELGFAPMKAKAYRMGYSLEGLRELELAPLETDEDRNGHYISDTLETLFNVVFEGTPAASMAKGDVTEEFTFNPVRARLFSPEAIGTYLKGLRFRNVTMQRIIELLSLSRGDRTRGRGRISYAQLGISQLGAVYESLLSFSGFFASEDLIELKPAGKPAPGPLEAAFFAPRRRSEEFSRDEIVYEGTNAKIYPRGTFIYRLAGRNRENSASFYTPEPLARVMVKYALKELLAGKKADDILKLRIVEPAMGSAAFLVEVVNQLADKYLELKQAELKKRIPHERYALERQKVRAYLADRNVFGVDLNPVAVELGQVSLWLDCLHEGGFAPWFEDQVHAGNSLVGARRAVFPVVSLDARREEDRWYKRKPREIGWSAEARKPDEVWHFLLPDPGMGTYDPKIVRPLAPDNWATFAEWRRDFIRPLDQDEIATVKRLSSVVDALFEDVADRLREVRKEVNDDISIWPAEPRPDERHVDFQEKIRRLMTFQGEGVKNAVSWRRLRSAMDAWCALWFWPLDKADQLPSRTKFFQDLDLILTQGIDNQKVVTRAFATGAPQGRLFETVTLPGEKGSGSLFRTEERVVELRRNDLFGDIDVGKLIDASPWLPTAMNVTRRHRFMHFDLEFADVMRDRGGFDLVIGNPPWLKPAWIDAHILSEHEPTFGIREVSSAEVERLKPRLFEIDPGLKASYLNDYIGTGGLQAFLSSPTCYPFLGGGQPNLYKCFIDLAFRITSRRGFAALIHQDNHLSDPDGTTLRRAWYRRIKRHYHFVNAIKRRLFAEVGHSKTFSLNVYSGTEHDIEFDHAALLLLPSMVDESYEHDGVGPVPSHKKPNGEWDTRGHRKRIVRIDNEVLRTFASVIEDESTPVDTTRFLFPYSTETLAVLQAFANGRTSFSDGARPFQMRPMLHESSAIKRDKLIESKVIFPEQADEVILTGSLMYVGNAFHKSPDENGRREVEVDLEVIPEDYLPRTYYSRSAEKVAYEQSLPKLGWDQSKYHASQYRIAFRNMLDLHSGRTLVAALIPPGFAHVHTIESLVFEDEANLVTALPLWFSLPFDFLVRTMGLKHFHESALKYFPWVNLTATAKQRALRLACLTNHYAEIWNRHGRHLDALPWSSDDPRLKVEKPNIGSEMRDWTRNVALRSDFARRQALVEIDVLVAQALGLSLDQLIEMYRTRFSVLEEQERGTWYDVHGRIAWTSSKGLPGVGYRKPDGRKPTAVEWVQEYASRPAGERLESQAQVGFLKDYKEIHRAYEAPFITCDREADYRTTWAFFEAQNQKKAA
ncbi:Eco57I restriction-modification methylase domain-containing protein [Microvirga sp. VF16]|uniref:Eco57I restriction-modification methylase domain-containing protein n=1 Tax=Microvirga sp. VF16 TaxID=2807101 RepID=UPI00193D054A|nr:N-6 DNA methylase [Microvirga sp. VF16]QRM36034.1 N-6 DNA methylase [Microvirga sp. VF16]